MEWTNMITIAEPAFGVGSLASYFRFLLIILIQIIENLTLIIHWQNRFHCLRPFHQANDAIITYMYTPITISDGQHANPDCIRGVQISSVLRAIVSGFNLGSCCLQWGYVRNRLMLVNIGNWMICEYPHFEII
jgi:hypothetical protein